MFVALAISGEAGWWDQRWVEFLQTKDEISGDFTDQTLIRPAV
jgi:hypothetical protein